MTGTNQLEMKLHEHGSQIGYLRHELAQLKKEKEELERIVKHLCERLMVQG